MVSVVLLLKILAFAVLFAASVYLYIKCRTLNARLESFKEHVSERISAIALEVHDLKALDATDDADPELAESRRKKAEAERRFNEAFASIMSYDIDAARGKKGEL
jgi:ABC-type transport system involved in cytochrome bd biosynthesis fused ATPase/permease subunit